MRRPIRANFLFCVLRIAGIVHSKVCRQSRVVSFTKSCELVNKECKLFVCVTLVRRNRFGAQGDRGMCVDRQISRYLTLSRTDEALAQARSDIRNSPLAHIVKRSEASTLPINQSQRVSESTGPVSSSDLDFEGRVMLDATNSSVSNFSQRV